VDLESVTGVRFGEREEMAAALFEQLASLLHKLVYEQVVLRFSSGLGVRYRRLLDRLVWGMRVTACILGPGIKSEPWLAEFQNGLDVQQVCNVLQGHASGRVQDSNPTSQYRMEE
jgi:hypothetical protein